MQTVNETKLYTIAKNNLGKHITLDPNVPYDVGCAEAVSFNLKQLGVVGIPLSGFASTADLYTWMKSLPSLFDEIECPEAGAIIISPSGTSTQNAPHGHVGICGNFGIMSNDSQSGLFLELWTVDKWNTYYGHALGFPVHFFRVK